MDSRDIKKTKIGDNGIAVVVAHNPLREKVLKDSPIGHMSEPTSSIREEIHLEDTL